MNKPSLPTLPTSPTLPTLPTFQISLKHRTLKSFHCDYRHWTEALAVKSFPRKKSFSLGQLFIAFGFLISSLSLQVLRLPRKVNIHLYYLQELSANCLAALRNPAHFSLTKFLFPIGPLADLVYDWYIALVFSRRKADNSQSRLRYERKIQSLKFENKLLSFVRPFDQKLQDKSWDTVPYKENTGFFYPAEF
jgi:hypothetical protein